MAVTDQRWSVRGVFEMTTYDCACLRAVVPMWPSGSSTVHRGRHYQYGQESGRQGIAPCRQENFHNYPIWRRRRFRDQRTTAVSLSSARTADGISATLRTPLNPSRRVCETGVSLDRVAGIHRTYSTRSEVSALVLRALRRIRNGRTIASNALIAPAAEPSSGRIRLRLSQVESRQ